MLFQGRKHQQPKELRTFWINNNNNSQRPQNYLLIHLHCQLTEEGIQFMKDKCLALNFSLGLDGHEKTSPS